MEEDESDIDVLREQLRRADAEIDRGEALDFDEHTTAQLAKDIHARGLKRLAELPHPDTRG